MTQASVSSGASLGSFPPKPATSYRWVVMAIIFVTYAINFADRTNIGVVLPFKAAGTQIKGAYLTGGDLTVAFCNALGASAIELEDEIIPHVSYGCLRGGLYDGMKVTTKGGFIGVADTAWHCIKYMAQK